MMTFTVKQEATNYVMSSSLDVYYAMKDIAQSDQESFWILGYDNGNRETLRQCVFIGGKRQCFVDVPMVIHRLLVAGISGWIAVHNHPGGNLTPSDEDKKITASLYIASAVARLEFFDHIIVSDRGYFSFADRGMMREIKNCYEPELFLLLNSRGSFDRWEPNKTQYLKKAAAFDQVCDLVKEKKEPDIVVKSIKKNLRKLKKELREIRKKK